MATPNPKNVKNMSPNTMQCSVCTRFRTTDRGKVITHMQKKHGMSRAEAQSHAFPS